MRRLLLIVALVVALVVALAGATGCASEGGAGGARRSAALPPLAAGTCWDGHRSGQDAGRALAGWPAFDRALPCGSPHAVEVYQLVRAPEQLARASYAALLRIDRRSWRILAAEIERGCMTGPLARTAARSGVSGAVAWPALPSGYAVGWAPPSPDRWNRGERGFACTLTQAVPGTVRYRDLPHSRIGTALRVCIDSRRLAFVDCARRHDRERIVVIEVGAAVRAGRLPGARRIRRGPAGRYVDLPSSRYAALDRACTAYLRSVSTTRRLTGVAEIDLNLWPDPSGNYPVNCEAEAGPAQKALFTRGSVFDR